MTQKPIDLLAALNKKGVEFIIADDMKSAVDSIESAMGKCWTDAKGSRRVAHQMLDDHFILDVTFYSSVSGDYVDKTYVPNDGEVLKELQIYRPMTDAEQQERSLHTGLKRLRREAEKAKPRHHREGSSRANKRLLEPVLTSTEHFDHLVARVPGVSSRNSSDAGGLLLG